MRAQAVRIIQKYHIRVPVPSKVTIPLVFLYNHHDEQATHDYPAIKDLALRVISMFGSTFICEHTFSRMKQTKTGARARLTDENLHSLLRLQVSDFTPNITDLAAEQQAQISH